MCSLVHFITYEDSQKDMQVRCMYNQPRPTPVRYKKDKHIEGWIAGELVE